MIFIAIGANLPGDYGSPRRACAVALGRLWADDIALLKQSRWYETAPLPVSDQPWYVNAVIAVETTLTPSALLHRLHALETAMGRVRREINAPRVIDLDLIDYRGQVSTDWPRLPHPRMTERAFVLVPLADIAPEWRHPVSGQSLNALLADLPKDQQIRVLEDPP